MAACDERENRGEGEASAPFLISTSPLSHAAHSLGYGLGLALLASSSCFRVRGGGRTRSITPYSIASSTSKYALRWKSCCT